jgi:hypothetical protein
MNDEVQEKLLYGQLDATPSDVAVSYKALFTALLYNLKYYGPIFANLIIDDDKFHSASLHKTI